MFVCGIERRRRVIKYQKLHLRQANHGMGDRHPLPLSFCLMRAVNCVTQLTAQPLGWLFFPSDTKSAKMFGLLFNAGGNPIADKVAKLKAKTILNAVIG